MRNLEQLVLACAAAAAVLGQATIGLAAPDCLGTKYLCFLDYSRPLNNRYGNVQYNNDDWSDFGWEDKADEFSNQGETHNVCVYESRYYNRDRGYWLIPNSGSWFVWGQGLSNDPKYEYWNDRVSSNRWTTRGISGC